MSSKAKKAASTTNDYVDYQPKDLIWAKMKGFTPWPSMVVEPPLDMIHTNRRPETKCVFFFGSRNFAWIEISKLKPFDGPWRAEMSRGGTKPSASFRTAIKDIEAYIENPLEVDAEINELIANKNASAPDFDRIRDGLENEEDDAAAAAAAGIDNGDVQANEIPMNKTPKRTPKPKVSGAASTKARSTIGSKTPTKRRRSSQANSSSKRKRSSLPARDDTNDSPNDRRRILNADTLATLGFATRRNPNSNALLHRPIVSRPDPQTVNMSHRSTVLAERAITPSELTFGFMGLGIMGAAIVKDLICTGHNVVVWNRTAAKCEPFVEAGAKFAATPMDVVELCDIIFCCVSDPRACKDLVFGNCGVLNIKDLNQKAYVEMTTIDPESSLDIAEGIKQNNGRYLEVQINGTRQEAEDGMLIVLAGGDRTVFEDCHSCFKTIAKNTFFLGDIGNACKVNLILQTIVGTSLVGLAEALALADRFSISLKDIIDIFELTSMKSPLLIAKGKEMAKGEFNPDHPLSHMQKDLRLVLGMAENLDQAMPLTATANEVFKHTKRLGYGEHDSSAVFKHYQDDQEASNIKYKQIVIENSQDHNNKCNNSKKMLITQNEENNLSSSTSNGITTMTATTIITAPLEESKKSIEKKKLKKKLF